MHVRTVQEISYTAGVADLEKSKLRKQAHVWRVSELDDLLFELKGIYV